MVLFESNASDGSLRSDEWLPGMTLTDQETPLSVDTTAAWLGNMWPLSTSGARVGSATAAQFWLGTTAVPSGPTRPSPCRRRYSSQQQSALPGVCVTWRSGLMPP